MSAGDPWRQRPTRWRASLVLMVASGFAGLGYQIVWTQQCALWLGHESAAVLAVITAFFGGLAVGALTLGPRIERSTRPARWYAGCELTIALWSLLLAMAMSPFSAWVVGITGVEPTPAWQWAVAFCGTFLLLLPATAAMGATLPAMERVTAQIRAEGRSIAALYASNTFGAVIGVLAITFWLAPEFGLVRTAGVCVAFNLLCCAASLALFPATSEAVPRPASLDLPVRRRVLRQLAVTGLLGTPPRHGALSGCYRSGGASTASTDGRDAVPQPHASNHRDDEGEYFRRPVREIGDGRSRTQARDTPTDAEQRRAAQQLGIEIGLGWQVEARIQQRVTAQLHELEHR